MTAAQARKAARHNVPKEIRCAIYTRKSTDEGLEMDFNSLDAQREAAEAFILSQRHEGWVALPERYDDGGYTGANMERPALKRLLADVEAGRVDAVVVYKVDRISRSLLDFSRIIEVLDRRACSFVSVTQQFNTTHSMGRLTLNILLSFAQFEREIISERTRDKMAAARRKGKWTGGALILGYDLDSKQRRLVINKNEAQRVRAIFALFLEKQSLLVTATELNRRGWPRKTWKGRAGQICGGGLWKKTNVLALVTNKAYIGKVEYRGEVCDGEHEAIVDLPTFQAAQEVLARAARGEIPRRPPGKSALLSGLLRCGACGCAMSPTYTPKGNKCYRYYVCQTAMKRGWDACPSRSVPAQEIEDFVMKKLSSITRDTQLVQEITDKAKAEAAALRGALQDERKNLQTSLREASRQIPDMIGQSGFAARMADLQDQIRAGENRMREIDAELAALPERVSKVEIAGALGRFDELLASMPAFDRARLLGMIIKEIRFDRAQSSIAITFHSTGFETLIQQAA